MDMVRVDPADDATVEELWTMLNVAQEHDRPQDPPRTRAGFRSEIDDAIPHAHNECHVARIDGQIAGAMQLGRQLSDNQHLFGTQVTVLPEFRRRGIGGALLDRSVEIGRAHGCRVQTSYTRDPLPGGPFYSTDGRDFLLGNGFTIANTTRGRRLDLDAVDEKAEQDLLDESLPHAEGYELVQWLGATPAEHVASAAALAGRMWTDVPQGDLDIDEVHYDAERYLEEEAANLRGGKLRASTYARDAAGGELVAYSVVEVCEEIPAYGWQWITLVHPDHRGHRLGMIVKIGNHRLLRRVRPGVRWIETANAEVNSHMVAINERLGFVEVGRILACQREI